MELKINPFCDVLEIGKELHLRLPDRIVILKNKTAKEVFRKIFHLLQEKPFTKK